MALTPDLTGQTFGRYTVLRRGPTDRYRAVRWIARCTCGTEKNVRSVDLRHGSVVSCGCYQKEAAAEIRRSLATHSHKTRVSAGSPTYRSWIAMRRRVLEPTHQAYARYGGVGITICDRWLECFENFLADMGERPADRSLDRIDPYGNYEPGNCRWATRREQALNKRKVKAWRQ